MLVRSYRFITFNSIYRFALVWIPASVARETPRLCDCPLEKMKVMYLCSYFILKCD
jgi:hypothetical protein